MPGIRLLFALYAAIVWLAPIAVSAGAFSVVPQTIRLAPDQRTGMVEVRNNAGIDTVFQIETFSWTDSPALEALTPTREILAVPAVFRLAAGDRQTVRVAVRTSPAQLQKELSYRLLVSEVPSNEQSGGVVFALRMSLPVFLTPQGAEGRLVFQKGPSLRRLHLSNPGTAHLRLDEVRMIDKISGNVVEKLDLPMPAYLLPERNLVLPFGIDIRSGSYRIEADTTGGRFQFDLSD